MQLVKKIPLLLQPMNSCPSKETTCYFKKVCPLPYEVSCRAVYWANWTRGRTVGWWSFKTIHTFEFQIGWSTSCEIPFRTVYWNGRKSTKWTTWYKHWITGDKILEKLISQVSKTQRHVAALEDKLDASVSSSTTNRSWKKRSKSVDVPKVVRVWSTDNMMEINNFCNIARDQYMPYLRMKSMTLRDG